MLFKTLAKKVVCLPFLYELVWVQCMMIHIAFMYTDFHDAVLDNMSPLYRVQ